MTLESLFRLLLTVNLLPFTYNKTNVKIQVGLNIDMIDQIRLERCGLYMWMIAENLLVCFLIME